MRSHTLHTVLLVSVFSLIDPYLQGQESSRPVSPTNLSASDHPWDHGEKIDIQFTIGDVDGNQLKVRFHQLLPDAFQEGRQVIVQGTMLSKDEVECKRLTVKCPSKYKDENKTDADNWKKYDDRKSAGELPDNEYPSK